MAEFKVVSEYSPAGDQPEAIDALAIGLDMGFEEQTLLGVTGSRKTYTMAKIIERVQRPTLVLAHNKTLAAQLCAEFKEFSRKMPWNTSYPITITTNRRPICPIRTHISKGQQHKRRDRAPASQRHLQPFERRDDCRGLRFVYLRPGRPYRLRQHGHIPASRADPRPGRAAAPPD